MKPGKRNWILAGGLVSACAASICCVGPLLALAMGAGSFSAAAFFATTRPYLLWGALTFLALAWLFHYRRVRAAGREGDGCTAPGKQRFAKSSLWIVSTLAIVAGSLPWLVDKVVARPGDSMVAGGAELRLSLPSVDCNPDARLIEAALKGVAGVGSVAIDVEHRVGTVRFDPSVVTVAEIVTAIEKTGFAASPANDSTSAPGRS